MAHLGESALFAAPIETDDGTKQASIDADLVVLPGGLLLVEQSSPLADLPWFHCDSGEIHCSNGRD